MNGIEKFWNQENVKAILQLVAFDLRDDGQHLDISSREENPLTSDNPPRLYSKLPRLTEG
jgi:hypothetical protein